jgi:hypothetical protein
MKYKSEESRENQLKGLIPFKKGQSGNPAGRVKGTQSFSTLIKQFLALPSDVFLNVMDERSRNLLITFAGDKIGTVKGLITMNGLIKKALKGDLRSLEMIMSQIDEEKAKPIEITDRRKNVNDLTTEQLEAIYDGRADFEDFIDEQPEDLNEKPEESLGGVEAEGTGGEGEAGGSGEVIS